MKTENFEELENFHGRKMTVPKFSGLFVLIRRICPTYTVILIVREGDGDSLRSRV